MGERATALALFAALAWAPLDARASGIAGAQLGFEQGSVVAHNPTAIYYNPGALGFSGTQLFIDFTLAMRELEWTHVRAAGETVEPAGFEGANYGTARASTLGAGPQLAGSVQLGALTLGIGFYAPYGGGGFQFDRNSRFAGTQYPGAADGVARWHGYSASGAHLFGSVGAALRWRSLAVGVTGNLVWSSYSAQRSLNAYNGFDNNLESEQRASVEASGLHGSFGVGLLVEAVPHQLWLGASYQAQPGLGQLELAGTYELDPTIGVDDATRVQDITLHDGLPDVVRAGASYRPSAALELRLSGSFTRWSLRRTTCVGVRDKPCTVNQDGSAAAGSGVIRNVRNHWDDTFGVHAGVSVWFMPPLETFAGFRFETAAVPDETMTPLSTDANNVIASVGARVAVGAGWFIALSYNHQQFFARDNTGLSRLSDPNLQVTSRNPDGGGRYTQWLAFLDLNITKTFS